MPNVVIANLKLIQHTLYKILKLKSFAKSNKFNLLNIIRAEIVSCCDKKLAAYLV